MGMDAVELKERKYYIKNIMKVVQMTILQAIQSFFVRTNPKFKSVFPLCTLSSSLMHSDWSHDMQEPMVFGIIENVGIIEPTLN